MVEMFKYIVSVDIGTSNTVTLVCEKAASGKIRVLNSSITPSSGVVKGDIRNVDQVVESILKSVKKIEDESNIKICEVYVGISGEHIKCSIHEGYVFIKNSDSEVTKTHVSDLSESMRNEKVGPGQTIIHILPQNYILDGDSSVTHPVGMIGKKLEGKFNIVICNRDNLSHLERCMKRANIDNKEVILSSLASAEAVLLSDEKELGAMVVDIGGGACDICIYHDKKARHMEVIPIGGNSINKEIKSHGVLERHVEKLKVKFGSALCSVVPENNMITLATVNNIPSKVISQYTLAYIIESKMMEIVEKIKQILINTGYENKLKGPIVLTGGCANMKNIDKLFSYALGYDVRIAAPTLYVTEDSIDKINSPEYSTAVGLILKGISVGKPTKIVAYEDPTPPEVQPSQNKNPYIDNQDDYIEGGAKDGSLDGGNGDIYMSPENGDEGDPGYSKETYEYPETDFDPGEVIDPDTEEPNNRRGGAYPKKDKKIKGWIKRQLDNVNEIFNPSDIED